MKFKVGDKVRFIDDSSPNAEFFRCGLEDLEIKSDDSEYDYQVYEKDKSGSWGVSEDELELMKSGAKSNKPIKPDSMIRFMAYGVGCNNKSGLLKTDKELKEKLREVTKDSDWTGEIIGYKLTPIYESGSRVIISKFKAKK